MFKEENFPEFLTEKIAHQVIGKYKLTRPPKNKVELARYDRIVAYEIGRINPFALRRMLGRNNDDYITTDELIQQSFLLVIEEMRKMFMGEAA